MTPMSILFVIVVFVLIGVLLYAVQKLGLLPPKWFEFMIVVVMILLIVWLITAVFGWGPMTAAP